LGVGSQAFVAVSKNSSYSFQECQYQCLQKLAVDRCGCADPLYSKTGAEHLCTTSAEVDCLLNLTTGSAAARTEQGRKLCECPQDWSDTIFSTVIS
ncbi:hypothetical protein PENTCL1PPCAC_12143, partial [Pristionchus entomophagus]